MCGATDCPSCGPAQGYEVIRVWDSKSRRFKHINPEDGEEYEEEVYEPEPREPDPYDIGSGSRLG